MSFVGAWTLFGFHEDGFTSGIRVAEKLGAKIPFEIVDARYIRGKQKRWVDGRRDRWDEIVRILLIAIQWIIMALSGRIMRKKKLH